MGNNCCVCNNRNGIDEGNLGEKLKNPNQKTRETRIQLDNIDHNNTNSMNANLTANFDLLTNNDTINKDPDTKIPINHPRVPRDKIPDSIINSKKKLKLIIKQSKYLLEGREFIINPGGLIGGRRNAKDGITIFGDFSVSKIIIGLTYIQSDHKNDFEFPEEESKTGQSHAEIKYDRNIDQYQIKSLRGSGCFLKIDKRIVNYILCNYF